MIESLSRSKKNNRTKTIEKNKKFHRIFFHLIIELDKTTTNKAKKDCTKFIFKKNKIKLIRLYKRSHKVIRTCLHHLTSFAIDDRPYIFLLITFSSSFFFFILYNRCMFKGILDVSFFF